MHQHLLVLNNTVLPAVENTRSEGVEVVGILSKYLATLFNKGYFAWLFSHQACGNVDRMAGVSDM